MQVYAVKNGVSVDTTMGFTPLEGITNGNKMWKHRSCYSYFLNERKRISVDEVNDILNKKSGVLGVSGISSDFRDIEEQR